MDSAILITARLSSTRLKRKLLLKVQDKVLIQWLIDRVYTAFKKDIDSKTVSIIIATSDEKQNRELEQLKNCSIYYGSLNNIPLRHLQCAKHYKVENIISIDGDDILCSTEAMKNIQLALLSGKEYCKTIGLPLGMNDMGYRKDFLENSLSGNIERTLETGWTRIFDEGKLYEINLQGVKNYPYLRFTLDYECDYEFFKYIINFFKKKLYTLIDSELVDYVIKNEIFLINREVAEGYWINFDKNVKNEDL